MISFRKPWTAGPWTWSDAGSHVGRECLHTPDRGRLYVVTFGRRGMQGATARFSQWQGIEAGEPRGRSGGIMRDGVRLPGGALHPDARLIEAAPLLADALIRVVARTDVARGAPLDADTIAQAVDALRAAGAVAEEG